MASRFTIRLGNVLTKTVEADSYYEVESVILDNAKRFVEELINAEILTIEPRENKKT